MADQIQRVTIGDAATMLGVSKDYVRRLIADGKLPAYRIGTGPRAPIRLLLDDVERQARPVLAASAVTRDAGDAA